MEDLNQFLKECADEDIVVVIKFGATWCGPCKRIHDFFVKLMEHYKLSQKLCFLEIDIDEDRDISDNFQIKQLPTFCVIKKDLDTKYHIGSDEKALSKFVAENI